VNVRHHTKFLERQLNVEKCVSKESEWHIYEAPQ